MGETRRYDFNTFQERDVVLDVVSKQLSTSICLDVIGSSLIRPDQNTAPKLSR